MRERQEAHLALWLASGNSTHLDEAHRLLADLRDRLPEDCRDTLIENVPLNRDIMKAWEEWPRGWGSALGDRRARARRDGAPSTLRLRAATVS